MNVTLPNGKVIEGVPEGTTKQQIMDKAIKSGLAVPEDFAPAQDVGVMDAMGSGFVRGVEQVTGGALQRMAEARKSQLDNAITELATGMQDGTIPQTNENFARLDALQSEAVRITQDLSGAQDVELGKRAEYTPVSQQRPIASTVGNIGGQIAAFPVPGMQAKIVPQMVKGAIEGGALGYSQPTIEGESANEAAGEGAAVGGALPALLRPVTLAAGAAYRGIKGALAPEVKQVSEYAAERGLPLTTSDVMPPETFAGRSAQALGEKIPLAGTGALRAEQQAARESQVKSISEKYGLPSDEEIIGSLNAKKDKLSAAAGKRYDAINEQMADTVISPSVTVDVIDKQLERLNRPGSIKNEKLTKILQSVKDDITSGAQDIKLMRDNRTRFREEIKGEAMAVNDTEQRIIDSVYKAMTDDITNSVGLKLGQGTAASLRQADAVWAREANELKKTKLKNIFNKGEIKPEEASKMLFSNDAGEIRTLFSSLDQTGRKNARAAVIQRAFDKSEGSPDRFLNEMKKLRNQSAVFFRGQEGKDLNGLINYLKYTKQAGKSSVLTKSGEQLFQLAPAAAVADVMSTGGVVTGSAGLYGAMARAYESQPVRNLLAKMASLEPGSTGFEKLAAQLEQEINKVGLRATTSQ